MTQEEYEEKIARIDALMDAEQGTPEIDELNRLADEVDEYETEHFPMPGIE